MKPASLMASLAALVAVPASAFAQYGPYSPAPLPVASGANEYQSNYGPSVAPSLDPADLPPAYPARVYRSGPGGILLPMDSVPPPAASHLPPPSVGSVPSVVPAPVHSQVRMIHLADQLVAQANAFLQAFSPKVRIVPQGRLFMADATALRNAALYFRQAVSAGAPPAQLAREFAKVSACWQRLESRMARVSHGFVGPNIATALQMGGTVSQIGQLLP